MKLFHLVWVLLALTRPDGLPIFINPHAVDYFTQALDNADKRARTMIELQSGTKLYVREEYEQVRRSYAGVGPDHDE